VLGIKMNINATLIVQAINFFIAYLLFRFILLKPAYAAIVEEQEAKAALEQLIADDKQLIESRRQALAHQWRESVAFFRKNLPEPIDQIALFKGTFPKIKLKPIEQSALAEVKTKVVRAMVEYTRTL
jgi:hypothetical protein